MLITWLNISSFCKVYHSSRYLSQGPILNLKYNNLRYYHPLSQPKNLNLFLLYQNVNHGKSELWNNDKITEFNIFYLNWTFLFSKILYYYHNDKHACLRKQDVCICRQTNNIRCSWVRVVLLPTLPSNWKSWNAPLSPTTFIHNYKNQIILHITIIFIIKPCMIIINLFHFYFHCMTASV